MSVSRLYGILVYCLIVTSLAKVFCRLNYHYKEFCDCIKFDYYFFSEGFVPVKLSLERIKNFVTVSSVGIKRVDC